MDSAAARLFIDRASKVRPDLSLEQELHAIDRICRLTEGMPLAIEIAASWTHMLDCTEIANEIEQNRQFLASSMRDIPERHRSIQAVFDQSMRLLEPETRDVFSKLSVFRGGFSRQAGEVVAGANLSTLSSLADRSLIRATSDGRYRIHELVRQFGGDQLAASEAVRAATQAAHSAYFMEFLALRHDDVSVSRQAEASREIEVELENVYAAWRYAVDNILAEPVGKALVSFAQYIQYRGRYAEGGRAFTHAVAKFKEAEQTNDVQRTLALLLVEHGWFNLRQGRFDASEAAFRESSELHARLDMWPIHGFAMDPELALAYVASARGDVELARKNAEAAIQHALEQKNIQHRGAASQLLGHLALRRGDLDEARERLNAAIDASAELGERWFTAYCHNDLGEVAAARGDYDEANAHFEASLEIGKDFGDRAGIGLSLVYLGETAALLGHTENARQYLEDSKTAYLELGDRGGMARTDCGFGVLSVATGDAADAVKRFSEVLDASLEMQFVAMILDVLAGIGELALRSGMDTDGERLLSFVDAHPSTESRTRTRLRTVINRIEQDQGQNSDIDEQVRLAREILGSLDRIAPRQTPTSVPTNNAAQVSSTLPESLTERELEILEHIADGLPNQRIADDLFVSLGTVKWHSNQIYTKLDVHNRTSAVARARELGILAAQD
jgi:DNA-binding CsgD family transcriptional regulator